MKAAWRLASTLPRGSAVKRTERVCCGEDGWSDGGHSGCRWEDSVERQKSRI